MRHRIILVAILASATIACSAQRVSAYDVGNHKQEVYTRPCAAPEASVLFTLRETNACAVWPAPSQQFAMAKNDNLVKGRKPLYDGLAIDRQVEPSVFICNLTIKNVSRNTISHIDPGLGA